jgi:very-short-patch-repair endonuclease
MTTKISVNPKLPELVEVSAHSWQKARPVRAVAVLAGTQDGVVGHQQLLDLGFSERWIQHRLVDGWLHQIFRGAYAVGHRRITWRGRYKAATLACGPRSLISHRSGGALHNLRRWSSPTVHVTVPGGGHEDRDGIVLHRVRRLDPKDIAVVDGIPVTGVARTCLDMAAVVRADVLDDILEAAERNNVFDLAAFTAVCGRGRTGSKALKRALLLYRPIPGWTRSGLERRLFRALRKEDVPIPAVNKWVAGCECDLVWVDQQLVVEVDGAAWHGTTAARHRDPQRDVRLQMADYAVMRVPENRLVHDIAGVVADIDGLLKRPGARTPARPGR